MAYYRIHSHDSPEKKYKACISNLLAIVVLTAINIGLLLANTDRYFLFSAYIPYLIVDYAMYLCGIYPAEYYGDIEQIQFYDKSVLIGAIIVAAIITLIYLLCWFMAKRRKQGALIFVLAFFAVDTGVMVGLNGLSVLMELIFHVAILICLVAAMVYCSKINNKKQTESLEETHENLSTELINGYSSALRIASDEKNRVFAETNISGMNIVFRRVKRTNELVINGYVFDEYVALAEAKHTLRAYYNGHKVEATYNGISHVKILVDSQEVAKKLRLF